MLIFMKSTPKALQTFLYLILALTGPLFGGSTELLWQKPSTALPDWVRNQVVYEINVRQYSESGTFAAVEADLDRIEALGVGILWLMPIHPIGELNRKGELGSYYAVKDYKEINPEFGTKDDFRSFVNAAKARGMYVILDWVGNHTAWDNHLATTHPEFYMTDDTGSFIPPLGFDWTDVIQIDFNNPDVLDYHIDVMRYWVTEFGIDGYRCDYATGIPTPFWNGLTSALLETRDDLFLLAEAEVPDHQLAAFHASYGWPMMHAFNAVAQGKHPASHLDDIETHMDLLFPQGADFLFMTSNHDENSWLGTVQERLGGGAEVFAAVSFIMDGIPLIYNGQEAGLNKRLEFFKRDPIEWKAHPLDEVYKTLCQLKTNHSALATGAPSIRIPSTDDGRIYSLMRATSSGKVLLIANLTADNVNEVALGHPSLKGDWKDAFSGESISMEASHYFELPSWNYRLFIQGN
jgi:glycosidase